MPYYHIQFELNVKAPSEARAIALAAANIKSTIIRINELDEEELDGVEIFDPVIKP